MLKQLLSKVGLIKETVPLPEPCEFHSLTEKHPYTSDIPFLEMKEFHLLFVPGEHKVDFPGYPIIEDGANLTVGFSKNNFEFYKYTADIGKPEEYVCVPLLSDKPSNFLARTPVTRIKGEIHAVTMDVITKLDELYKNGVQFKRVRALITIPFRKVVFVKDRTLSGLPLEQFRENGDMFFGRSITHTFERTYDVKAWMYIGIAEHWDPLINSYNFEPVQTYAAKRKKWLGSYFHLRKNE